MVDLREALRDRDLERVVQIINSLFAEIPHQLWASDKELFFHAVIYLSFRLLGTYIHSEVNSVRGRCDAVIQTDDYIYAFEFKLDRSAKEALAQIQNNGYLHPYADDPREKVAVGINFSSKTRQIEGWGVEG